MKTESIEKLAVSLKGIFTKVAVAGVLAGTVLLAAPNKAAGQGVSVQFGVGHAYARPYYGPVYAPPIYGPAFYAEQRRRDEWLRHDRWEREHAFHGRTPAYGYYGR